MSILRTKSRELIQEGVKMKNITPRKMTLVSALSVALLGATSMPLQAFEFSGGEWSANLDTTISYGASWRMDDLDPTLVGKQSIVNNPAVFTLDKLAQRDVIGRWSANGDDGNLNYPESGDLISHAIKATVEFDIRWRNYGGFARATAFYDFENADKDSLSDIAQERVGGEARLLDAYIYGNHQPGDRFLTWRLGKQVVSWGESTFIQGGINVINPVDLSKLRVAGAELKEAFEGVNMIWGSIDLTPSLALEGLYMFEHREIRPDPAGTYFSTNDIGSPGATYAMLGFVYPQPVVNPDLYQDVCRNQNYGASDSPLPPELVAVGCGLSLQRSETMKRPIAASLAWPCAGSWKTWEVRNSAFITFAITADCRPSVVIQFHQRCRRRSTIPTSPSTPRTSTSSA